jgi:hypothetical protein
MRIRTTSVLTVVSLNRFGAWTPAIRLALAAAIACTPVTAALAQGTQATRDTQPRQNEGQRQATPGRLTVPVSGTLGTAPAPVPETPASQEAVVDLAAEVAGSFSIQRFARTTTDGIAAVGTLTLILTDPTSNAARTVVTQGAMPLASGGELARSTGANGGASQEVDARAQPAPAAAACETVSLVLGAIQLDLNGTPVQLDQVNVDLTAAGAPGNRFGSLLCRISTLLEGADRPADLVRTLNALLDMVG